MSDAAYSPEETKTFVGLAQSEIDVYEAAERVRSAPSESKFYIYGTASEGVIVAAEGFGVQSVVSKVALGTFNTKEEATTYQAFIDGIIQSGESIGTMATAGAKWLDGITGTLTDTLGVNDSTISELTDGLANRSMLETFLTSNSPTINVAMVLDEVCEYMVTATDITFSWSDIWDEICKLAVKEFRKAIRSIIESLFVAMQNAMQKLLRMVTSKIKSFLADYVADECISNLATALTDFENPANALNIEKFADSVWGIFKGAWKDLNDAYDEFNKVKEVSKELSEAMWSPFSPAGKAYWIKQWANAKTMMMEFFCARTKAYQDAAADGVTQAIADRINASMQSCLFQQALKSAKKFAPDSVPTNVLNRISDLAQQGSFMDAYNVALAAGIDLTGKDFQVELPSANSWVTEIYGDPYLFAPETPMNSSQVAKFLLDGMPSTQQLMDGDLTEEQMSQSWVAENWTDEDTKAAKTHQSLQMQAAYHDDVIAGMKWTASPISFAYAGEPSGEIPVVKPKGT